VFASVLRRVNVYECVCVRESVCECASQDACMCVCVSVC